MTGEKTPFEKGWAAAYARAQETMEFPTEYEWRELLDAALEDASLDANAVAEFYVGFAASWREQGGTAPEGAAYDPSTN